MKNNIDMVIIVVYSALSLYIVIDRIKNILRIKMGKADETVIGKIVGRKPFLFTGDISPIVECNQHNSTFVYTYHYFYSKEKYPLGGRVELKLSKKSGLLYDKKDLIKELVLYVFGFLLFESGLIVGICLFYIM